MLIEDSGSLGFAVVNSQRPKIPGSLGVGGDLLRDYALTYPLNQKVIWGKIILILEK